MEKTILKIQKSRFELTSKEVKKAIKNGIEDSDYRNICGDDIDIVFNEDGSMIVETTVHVEELLDKE